MAPLSLPFKRAAVASHPRLPQGLLETHQVAAYLQAHGLEAVPGEIYDPALVSGVQNGEFDIWIAIGGDGTMLRSGHICAPHNIPILGINMGNLGFLLEVQRNDWPNYLDQLLAGKFWLEHRMMLRAEQFREGLSLGSWDVLNEAMVGRGELMRPVRLTTRVDGNFLTTYVADGLIAATPTGSTAYALAAGGPILPPELRNILIVPVAPHLSVDRAIVLAEGSEVHIQVQTDHKAALCIDGQQPVPLFDRDEVHICANEHSIHFIRFQDPGYFYRNLTSLNRNQHGGPNDR